MECLECRGLMSRPDDNQISAPSLCNRCGSYWFEKGQIGSFLSEVGSRQLDDFDFSRTTKGIGDTCPSCGQASVEYGALLTASFRRCSNCLGIFLTPNEAADIRRMLAEEAAEVRQSQQSPGRMIDWLADVVEFLANFFTRRSRR